MEMFWILLTVLVASLIKGITGFGFALVALPVLVQWYSPKELVPVLILCNMVASVIIVLQKKEHKLIDTKFQFLIGAGAITTIFGVLILKFINEQILIYIMAGFFIVLSLLVLLKQKSNGMKFSTKAHVFVGSLCGLITGCISVSGPPLALFMNMAKVSNQTFREVFAWFSIATSAVALVGFYGVGMLQMSNLKMALSFLPILYVGSFIGKRVNHYLPVELFKKGSVVLCLISCVFMLL
ncbi:sulfite exporter TauE/SafE family protein [Prolixibacteraceae bacterium JC049]|nr:sulfite exporter TauE/SafE family protein [Prolixibacteraceae bacterium JC049]